MCEASDPTPRTASAEPTGDYAAGASLKAALRRLLAQALVEDYLAEETGLSRDDGERPLRNATPSSDSAAGAGEAR